MPDRIVLLQKLRQLVLDEFHSQRLQIERQWSLPLAERVWRGYAIEGLQVDGVHPDGLIRLSCQRNDSRFREGDVLALHRGDPSGPAALEIVLEEDDETLLEVSLQRGDPAWLQDHPSGWIADESLLDMTPYYLKALDQVADTRRGRERILPLLAGDLANDLDYARYERAHRQAEEAGLNPSQAESVAQAYAAGLYHLIQGPPGTGKTYVLAHLVRLLVAEGQRVLITGLTHRAINNALNKAVRVAPDLPICKIGPPRRADGLEAPNEAYFAQCGFGDLSGGYAIGATPFATQTKRLANVEFDAVIFDEASQITLPLAMMGMLPAQKYIFIGDERQLPPVSRVKSSALASASIFGYLGGQGAETLLETTYRLNEELAAWPSRQFYEGAIRPAPEAARRRLHLEQIEPSLAEALDPERPVAFIEMGGRNTTTRSQREAEMACDLVLALLAGGLPPWEIGVVVPYRAQGRLIRNLLRQALPDPLLVKEVVVDTVERMQGQEREAVIVSLTTSSPAFASGLADFFFQPERLNVSITRPRTKLILLGSRQVLTATPADAQQAGWVALMADLIAHCSQVNL